MIRGILAEIDGNGSAAQVYLELTYNKKHTGEDTLRSAMSASIGIFQQKNIRVSESCVYFVVS